MKHLIILIGAACVLIACAFFYGKRIESQAWEHRLAQERAHATEQARRLEQQRAAQFQTTNQQLIQQWEQSNAEKDRIIADLRNGHLRLRKRLTTRDTVSTDAPTAGQCHATEEGGLSTEDAEFLVRFAAEADRNTEQLAACQAIIFALY